MMADRYSTESTLERIIGFIGHCDQKANMLLAFVGVVITLLFTSGLFDTIKSTLVVPFIDYWKYGIGTFHCGRFLLFISIMCVCLFAGYALWLLIKVIRPQIDNKNSLSRIYFGDISIKTFEDFKIYPIDYNYEEDLLHQIHINSQICAKKYVDLKKAINYIIAMIISCFVMYILILFL